MSESIEFMCSSSPSGSGIVSTPPYSRDSASVSRKSSIIVEGVSDRSNPGREEASGVMRTAAPLLCLLHLHSWFSSKRSNGVLVGAKGQAGRHRSAPKVEGRLAQGH